jgi:hypothetical protein
MNKIHMYSQANALTPTDMQYANIFLAIIYIQQNKNIDIYNIKLNMDVIDMDLIDMCTRHLTTIKSIKDNAELTDSIVDKNEDIQNEIIFELIIYLNRNTDANASIDMIKTCIQTFDVNPDEISINMINTWIKNLNTLKSIKDKNYGIYLTTSGLFHKLAKINNSTSLIDNIDEIRDIFLNKIKEFGFNDEKEVNVFLGDCHEKRDNINFGDYQPIIYDENNIMKYLNLLNYFSYDITEKFIMFIIEDEIDSELKLTKIISDTNNFYHIIHKLYNEKNNSDGEMSSSWTSTRIRNFSSIMQITDINLYNNSSVTDDDIKHIVTIKNLNLNFNKNITDNGIKYMINMQKLGLSHNKNITNSSVKNMINIEKLDLTSNKNITNSSVKNMINMKNLNLDSNDNITNDGIKHMANIEELDLTNNKNITNDRIKDMINMKKLVLNYNKNITNDGIKDMTKMQFICLFDNKNITDNGITNMINVEYILLSANITDNGIKRMVNMKEIDLMGKNITDDGIKHMINLQKLNLSHNTIITNDGIKHMNNITHLNLNYNKNITNDGIKHMINMTHLNLSDNHIITDDGVKHMINMEELIVVRNKILTYDCTVNMKRLGRFAYYNS